MVEGAFQLVMITAKEGVRLNPVVFPMVMAFGDRYQSELAFARNTKDLAVKLGNLSWNAANADLDMALALLSGDLDEAAAISEPYRMVYEYGSELIQAAWQEVLNSPPEKQGELLGRVVFELASLAAIYAKAGQVGKLGFLNRVRELPFFRQNPEAMRALQRIGPLMEELATTKMCFVAGTKVHTAQGLRNIEDIVAGDQVLSRDPKTGAQGFKAVRQTVVTHPTRLYHVWYRGREARSHGDRAAASSADADAEGEGDGEPSELVSTGEHPYFVVGREAFTPASELTAGDLLGLADGRTAEVVEIRIEDATGDAFTTYNFEVEDFHTYFVGQEGVWVHNLGAADCQRLFAVYEKLVQRGKTPAEIMKFLEARLPGASDAFMGKALERALGDGLLPGLKFWTKGEHPEWFENAWSHWTDHSRKVPRDIPTDITDAFTYVKRALEMRDQPRSTLHWGTRIGWDGLLEEVRYDEQSKLFCVFKLVGDERGAMKTFYIPEGDELARLKYFRKQGPFIEGSPLP
jgi:hypothetical protein